MTDPPTNVQPVPHNADQLIQDLPCQTYTDRHFQCAQRGMRPRKLLDQVNMIGSLDVPLNANQAWMGWELGEQSRFP